MYWWSYSGDKTSYGTIAPGGTMAMTTYVTHPWSAETASGKVMVNHEVVYVPVASDNGLEIPIADEGFQIVLPESCVDDMSTTDDAGDTCEWYFPEYCSG
jgi:hypothetical protein